MVEISIEPKCIEENNANEDQSKFSQPVLRREPSFSRWYDENGVEHVDGHLGNSSESLEDCDFELPFLQTDSLEEEGNLNRQRLSLVQSHGRSMNLNGALSMGSVSNGNGKSYVPFDIENSPERELQISETYNVDLSRRLGPNHQNQNGVSMGMILKTLFLIVIWYVFSTCLTLYNKELLGENLGKFPAPLLMNTIHFSMQAVLSKIIVRYSQNLQPDISMSWRDYLIRVVPTALATAFDVNLSNASLVFISVTFATMCKSAAPIFLLLFAFAFRLERPSFKLLGIILIISIGVLLTVAKETEFEFWGFVFVMLAAVMSGFRWCMTQILLQKEVYGLKHPITLMSYVTPIMALTTALLSLLMDPWNEFKTSGYFNSSWHIYRSCLLMILGGSLAFFMVLTEYVLVSVTSAVTVTIAGVVKEAVTILVAVLYFHDQFTLLKGIGLVTIMAGVSLFNWYKYLKLQKSRLRENGVETGSSNASAKYVILESMDEQEDDV